MGKFIIKVKAEYDIMLLADNAEKGSDLALKIIDGNSKLVATSTEVLEIQEINGT